MKRLSDLNGCSNVQDFQKKYFSKSGNTVKLFEAKKANNSLKMDTITFSKINKEFSKRDTAVKDNAYSDTIRSKTEIMKKSPSIYVCKTTLRGRLLLSIPYLIAFSTIGYKIAVGIRKLSVSGSIINVNLKFSNTIS